MQAVRIAWRAIGLMAGLIVGLGCTGNGDGTEEGRNARDADGSAPAEVSPHGTVNAGRMDDQESGPVETGDGW